MNTYEKYSKMVWSISWRFWEKSRFTGIEVDDLFQEGCIALLEAEGKYSPDYGTQFSTFAYWVIKNHLIDVLRKYQEFYEFPDFIPDPTPFPLHNSSLDFYQHVNNLSEPALELYRIVLDRSPEFFEIPPKKVRGILKEKLRDMGWSWSTIWDAFRELKMLAKGDLS